MNAHATRLVALLTSALLFTSACDDDEVDAERDGDMDGATPRREDAQAEASSPLPPLDAAPADSATSLGPDIASGDPGRPASPYGPKAEARLFLGEQNVGYVFFTALAPELPDLAHLFAVPEPRVSENVSDYYLSIVVDRATWKVATYQSALGGRVRFTLTDGRTYAANAADVPVQLTITQTTAVSGDVILRGELEMTLPASQQGATPLVVKMKINQP